MSASRSTYDVVTVGGGAAGVATASSLLERDARLSIVVVGHANEHFYQQGHGWMVAHHMIEQHIQKDHA